MRLTVPFKSTRKAQLVVPLSAVSLGPDGASRVQRSDGGTLRFVPVEPGLSADGYVAVTPDGPLAVGDLVVVVCVKGRWAVPVAERAAPLVRLEAVSRHYGEVALVVALARSTWRSTPGNGSPWSGRRARARRPCSTSWAAWTARAAAPTGWTAWTWPP